MSQRAHCPACTDWEILSHNLPRRDDWKCSKCGATANTCPLVIIRFGNQFITNRPDEERRFETTHDHVIARRYTFADAESIRIQMAGDNKMVDLLTPKAAADAQAKRDHDNARSTYFGAFTTEVHRLAALDDKPIGEKWTYDMVGVGCAQTVYGADCWFGSGIDPYTAAGNWYAVNKPKKVKRRKTSTS